MVSNIPQDIVAPLLAFDVESAGNNQTETRMALLGHGLSSGTLANGGIAVCSSAAQARVLVGRGSMLESMVIKALANAPAQEIWIGRVEDTGTAEVRTITVGDPPASGGQGLLTIAGETISVEIAAGDDDDAVAAAIAAAINAYINPVSKKSLPFTATAATDVVTLTARHKGTYATGIEVFVPVTDTVNAFSGLLVFATTTAGAGVPNVSAVLAAMGDDPFEIVISAFGDSSNLTRLDDFHNSTSGRWSYIQQLYGHVFYSKTGTVSEQVTAGLARDTWHLSVVPRTTSAGNSEPDYEHVTGAIARIAPLLGDDVLGGVSVSHSGLKVEGISAPRDRTYWPDYTTRNTLLKNGVSTLKIGRDGDVLIDKIITQVQTMNGVPDTVFRDVQAIYQITAALKYIRARLGAKFANKAIVDDNPGNLENLVTSRDIKAEVVACVIELANRGVLEATNAALSAITVTRDAANANRVNIFLPLNRANPLDIFAGLARVYA